MGPLSQHSCIGHRWKGKANRGRASVCYHQGECITYSPGPVSMEGDVLPVAQGLFPWCTLHIVSNIAEWNGHTACLRTVACLMDM